MIVSFTILGLLILLFIAWPLLNTILSADTGLLWQTLFDQEVKKSILLTFESSLIATLIAFIGGVPLAYLLARYDFPGKWLVEGIIDVPVVVPHTVVGIALLLVFWAKIFSGAGFQPVRNAFCFGCAGNCDRDAFCEPFLFD